MAFILRNGSSSIWRISRNFCRTAIRRDANPASDVSKPAPVVKNASEDIRIGGRTHKVDNLEKRFLVWSGRYKSVNEVPAFVSQEAMEKARNKARIRIANYMMLATVVGCIIMVMSGKRAADRGESVQKMNLEWHRQFNEDNKSDVSK